MNRYHVTVYLKDGTQLAVTATRMAFDPKKMVIHGDIEEEMQDIDEGDIDRLVITVNTGKEDTCPSNTAPEETPSPASPSPTSESAS